MQRNKGNRDILPGNNRHPDWDGAGHLQIREDGNGMAEVKREAVKERFTGQDKAKGVNRVKVNYDYEGLNWDFIKLLAEIAAYARGKYGSIEQYADIYPQGDQSPLNHIAEHMRQYMARELHDKFGDLKHQLAAIAYNAMMEFYYLEHGGPTVTDKLYRKEEGDEIFDIVPDIPVHQESSIIIPIDAPESVHQSLLDKFFGGLGGGKGKGSLQ
jgi:hypothetical protein